MDQEILFTSSKWDILKILSSQKKSPLELSRLAKTSMANVSQQLRLLEFAGIVKSERVSNRDKDLPRVLYTLTGNKSYLITIADNFVMKKFIPLDDYHQAILRIWYTEDAKLHYFAEKAFWKIENYLNKIDAIYLDLNDTKDLSFTIISKDPQLAKSITEFSIKSPESNITKQIKFKFIDDVQKIKQKELYKIYSHSAKEETELKK